MEERGPKWLYLHGFGSGPQSSKGVALADFGFYEDALAIDAQGDGWPDVRIPVLVLHGRRDEVVDIELSRSWARGKRHVRLVELDDDHQLTGSIARIAAEADAFLRP